MIDTYYQEQLAELTGILLGDGSINVYPSDKYATYYRLKVSFHTEDVEYIRYVSDLVSTHLNCVPLQKHRENENTAELLVFNKSVVKHLLNLGLVRSPKRGRATIPEVFLTKKLGRYVLRGYFDTDGSVVLTTNGNKIYPRLEMKVCRSPMQHQILRLLRLYGFQYCISQLDKDAIRIQLNGDKMVRKWFELISWSNPKHFAKAACFINK